MEGFSREELAAAASRQQRKVAPSKEEILAAIDSTLYNNPYIVEHDGGVTDARKAIEKLFADRGL